MIKEKYYNSGKAGLKALIYSILAFIICLFHDLIPRPASSIIAVITGIISITLLLMSFLINRNYKNESFKSRDLGRIAYWITKLILILISIWIGLVILYILADILYYIWFMYLKK